MFQTDLRALLAARAQIDSEEYWTLEQCQERETDLICTHIDEAIAFLREDCTAEEFIWLSEIFDDVTWRSRSRAFVQAIRALLCKYPEESQTYHLEDAVSQAEGILQDMAENPGWYQFLDELQALVHERSALSPKDESAIQRCNGAMADLLCANLEYAIEYLQEGCSAEEYVWVSEVFPEVAQRTHSEAFVQAIRTLPRRYPKETRRHDILLDIKAAEQALHVPVT